MRKRSLSVACERPAKFEQISNNFEGVPSEHEQQSETEEESDEEVQNDSDWTASEYQTLLDRMRGVLPQKDTKKFQTTLNKIDWKQVAFDGRTADEVKTVAESLIRKIRKYRTLSEVVNDIPLVTKKPTSIKKPMSAYNFYVKEKYQQVKEKHADLQSREIFKLIYQQFSALSEKKKKKYEAMSTDAKELYKQQLEEYYRDFPEALKKTKTAKKSSTKAKSITPFGLFCQDMRIQNLSTAEMRAGWNQLEVKQKLKYVQQAFKTQTNKTALPLRLTKEEQSMIEHAKGKPESIPRSTSEYYLKHFAEHSNKLSLIEWRKQKLAEFKNLPKVRKLELEIEYRQAKQDYVTKYENYITNITDEKVQQAEIDLLKSFIAKKMDKDDRQQLPDESRHLSTKMQSSQLENEMLDLPIAESTILSTKTKKAKTSAQKKDSPIAGSSKPFKSILKSPAKKDAQPAAQTFVEPAVPQRKRMHSLNEYDSDSTSEKKSKRSIVRVPIVAMESKENGNISTAANTVQEPVPPPANVIDYYMQNHYLGKKKNCAESFKNLSANQKEEMREKMRLAQRKYFKELQKFLKTVPPKDIKTYIKKVKQAQIDFDIGNSLIDDSGLLAVSMNKKSPKQEPQTTSDSGSSEENSEDENNRNGQNSGTSSEQSSDEE
ncbi:nucleolar transcription factor 1-like [Anopheles moucheti]|uniref:nucleolar transcription factor 1-like n=1 Tax=Anopheles moucheti TaxID=186751 RepID=UPI0022F049F1|nr:nucleolar transcription factor 1-like [Anopheles moucheti]